MNKEHVLYLLASEHTYLCPFATVYMTLALDACYELDWIVIKVETPPKYNVRDHHISMYVSTPSKNCYLTVNKMTNQWYVQLTNQHINKHLYVDMNTVQSEVRTWLNHLA